MRSRSSGCRWRRCRHITSTGREICEEIFAHHTYYSGGETPPDVPAFHPVVASTRWDAPGLCGDGARGQDTAGGEWGWEDALIAWHIQQAHRKTGDVDTQDRRKRPLEVSPGCVPVGYGSGGARLRAAVGGAYAPHGQRASSSKTPRLGADAASLHVSQRAE